jgi:hypothetical protein
VLVILCAVFRSAEWRNSGILSAMAALREFASGAGVGDQVTQSPVDPHHFKYAGSWRIAGSDEMECGLLLVLEIKNNSQFSGDQSSSATCGHVEWIANLPPATCARSWLSISQPIVDESMNAVLGNRAKCYSFPTMPREPTRKDYYPWLQEDRG